MHDSILKIIEMNLKEAEDTDLVEVFQNANHNARGVSDATASPHEGKREAVCIASPGKQVFPYSPVSPRKSMEGRRATSSTALASTGNQQAASNSHVSPIRSMAGRRVTSSTPPVSPRKQATPNSHASLRRSMAGRRAASSTALGAGSNSGHPLFRRQFSLRGCIPEENFEAKQSRLHDYTESPVGVCKLPFN
jgi:hypothetical protein